MEIKWLSKSEFGFVVDVAFKSRLGLLEMHSGGLFDATSDEISSLVCSSVSAACVERSRTAYSVDLLNSGLPCVSGMNLHRSGLDRWVCYALFGCSSCRGLSVSDETFTFLMSVLKRAHDRLYGSSCGYDGWVAVLSANHLRFCVSFGVSCCTAVDELGFVTAFDELGGVEAIIGFVCDLLQLERAWLLPPTARPAIEAEVGSGVYVFL